MKHKITPYYDRVKKENEFQDYFDRKIFSTNLTNLLLSTEDSLIISINAKWGEGKTTFVKKWQDDLASNDIFIPIYFDAFKNDFASDAFISLAVTIQKAIQNYNKKNGRKNTSDSLINRYAESATSLGFELAKMALNTTLNISTGGLLQADNLIDFLFGKARQFDKNENKALIDEKYDSFLKRNETIEDYHRALKDLLKSDDGESRKIIFFIDELDRCRPSFAIQVIEKVKHLFSIENVNFVLTVNRNQLIQIIQHSYGVDNEDADLYFQKFIDIETTLPELSELKKTDIHKLKTYLEELLRAFEIPEEILSIDVLYGLIQNSIDYLKYTPRSIERMLSLFTISTSSIDEKKVIEYSDRLILLCLLKIHSPFNFKRAKESNQLSTSKMINNKKNFLGTKFYSFIVQNESLNANVFKNSSNYIEINGLKESAKIVDMYDLPSENKIFTKE